VHGSDGYETSMGFAIPNQSVEMFDCFFHLDGVNPYPENFKTWNVVGTPKLTPQKLRC